MTKQLKRRIVLGGLAAGLVVTAAVLYYQTRSAKPTAKTTDQSAESANDLPAPASGQAAPSGQTEKDQTEAATSKPQTSSFTVSVTRAGQVSSSVQIRALVEGATSGQCKVNFSGPGTAFSKTSGISFDGRTYSCGALDAATSDFSKAGTWNYSLQATSGSSTSNTAPGQVTVTK